MKKVKTHRNVNFLSPGTDEDWTCHGGSLSSRNLKSFIIAARVRTAPAEEYYFNSFRLIKYEKNTSK